MIVFPLFERQSYGLNWRIAPACTPRTDATFAPWCAWWYCLGKAGTFHLRWRGFLPTTVHYRRVHRSPNLYLSYFLPDKRGICLGLRVLRELPSWANTYLTARWAKLLACWRLILPSRANDALARFRHCYKTLGTPCICPSAQLLPIEHDLHCETVWSPVSVEYVPLGHTKHADRSRSGLYRPASHVMHENGLLPRCMVGGQLPHFKDLHFVDSNRTTTPPSPSKQPLGDLQPLDVVKP